MEAMRNSWTDDRLDLLNQRVDEGFERMGSEFVRVEKRFDERFAEGFGRMDAEFARVDKRFDVGFGRMKDEFARIDKRFDKVEDAIVLLGTRFDSLQRTLIAGLISLVGVAIAATAAIIAAS
jgi:hypothetical protein